MNPKITRLIISLILAFCLSAGWMPGRAQDGPDAPAAAQGSAFTYQGRLSDGGAPAEGSYDFRFLLYDAVVGGAQVGSLLTVGDVSVTDGYFTVSLDFGAASFRGQARWLEIAARPGASTGEYTVLAPRQALTATPYALYSLGAPWSGLTGVPAGFADGVDNDTTSFWSLTGNAGTLPGTNFLGTSDYTALEIRVNNSRALRIEPTNSAPNLVGGWWENSITAGVHGGTIGGGGLIGDANRVTDSWATVGGGYHNTAGNDAGTVLDAQSATVGGGASNIANGLGSTVSGGRNNTASGEDSTVAGGAGNNASAMFTTVGGGFANSASASYASVGGGLNNIANDTFGTIAGGYNNQAGDNAGTTDDRPFAAVGGGRDNIASGASSVVAGGDTNTASGDRSTVPGGVGNVAAGHHSFAAGRRAKANHNGAFVWADSLDVDFSSLATDSFRVRASNGADFVASNGTGFGLVVTNNGAGDSIRAVANTSNGPGWAAVYAVNNGSSPAVYANSNGTYSGYFYDNIYVDGNCVGCTTVFLAYNASQASLETGDLVAARGLQAPLLGSGQPTLEVGLAGLDGAGVIGVVLSRVTVVASQKDGLESQGVELAEGAAASGEYLFVVVQGFAQVKVDPAAGALQPGERLTVAAQAGLARALQTREVDGMLVTEGAPVIGIALSTPEPGSALVPVFVNLQ